MWSFLLKPSNYSQWDIDRNNSPDLTVTTYLYEQPAFKYRVNDAINSDLPHLSPTDGIAWKLARADYSGVGESLSKR